jgi:hypothetical protein
VEERSDELEALRAYAMKLDVLRNAAKPLLT